MISVEQALERMSSGVRPVSTEVIPLIQGLGRVLSEDVVAQVSHPPIAVSAMDGYAVRCADITQVPMRLRCVGKVRAGTCFNRSVEVGQAVRIFTGAAVPEGVDTVIAQEDVTVDKDDILLTKKPLYGQCIRVAGYDFEQGQVCLYQGDRLTTRALTLLSAMNVPWLRVYRRPRVAILSTGDELVLPGEAFGLGQIINASQVGLGSFVESLGGEVMHLRTAMDSIQDLTAQLLSVQHADVLVLTGGVSVGERDFVRAVLLEQGMDLDFWKIAMRPGKPFLFGRWRRMLVFGLPGNPVSTLLCAFLFLRPVLRLLQGLRFMEVVTETARLTVPLAANDARVEYMRAMLDYKDHHLLVRPFSQQESHLLLSLSRAECLLIRPAYAPALGVGESVSIIRLTHSLF